MMDRTDDEQLLDQAWCGLMDEQLDDLQLQRLLNSAGEDDLERWNRYQLVRSVLRNELPPKAVVDLRAGIAAAIADEDQVPELGLSAAGQPAGRRLWRAVGSAAIAASVAIVVVLGGLELRDDGLPSAGGREAVGEVAGLEVDRDAVPAAGQAELLVAEQPEIIRLAPGSQLVDRNRNLPDAQRHADMAVLVGAGGMSPYARVTTLQPVLVSEGR